MNFKTLILITMLLACSINPALGRELIVALSAQQSASENKQQVKQVLQFLTSLEAGSEAVIVDANDFTLLGTFSIPTKKAYANPNARLSVNRAVVGQLMRFAERPTVKDDGKAVSRLPALLRHIARNFPSDAVRDVVVLASPIAHDPAQPAYTMTGLRFAGDGHLFADLGKTPYSATQVELFKRLRVHIAYQDKALRHEQYRYFVQRFWTLFVEKQGGRIASFVGDLPTLFRRIKTNAALVPHNHKAEQSDKLEMIQLRGPRVEQSIYDRPVTTAPLSAQEVKWAEGVQIGLSWDCPDCDIDLYAQPHQGAQTLYFANKNSDEGRFWKDFRRSPKSSNGRETISFDFPVDLRTLRIVLNFYRGTAPNGIIGEVRLSVKDATYAQSFHFDVVSGNGSSDTKAVIKNGRSSSHSIYINPLQLVAAQ